MHPFYAPSARLVAGSDRRSTAAGLVSMAAYLGFWAAALAIAKRELDARFPRREPAVDDPAARKPAGHDPAVDDPAAHNPAAHNPAVDDPAAYDPAAHDPAMDILRERYARGEIDDAEFIRMRDLLDGRAP